MADYCDEGGCGEGKELVRGYGVGEGTEEFLAVLFTESVSILGSGTRRDE